MHIKIYKMQDKKDGSETSAEFPLKEIFSQITFIKIKKVATYNTDSHASNIGKMY